MEPSSRSVATDSPRINTPHKDTQTLLNSKLKPVAAKWKAFGLQLRIPYSQLSKSTTGKKSCDDCFQEMIDYWLKNGSHIWQEIFDALEEISQKGLMRKLKRSYEANNAVELDAVDLINKLQTITFDWKNFGAYLNIPPYKLKAIAADKTCEDCLREVIDLWCNDNDADNLPLDMIYEALRNIDQRNLASELETFFRGPPQQRVGTDSAATDEVTHRLTEVSQSSQGDEGTSCIDEQEELTDRLQAVTLSNEYTQPVQATNDEDDILTRTSQVYQDSVDALS